MNRFKPFLAFSLALVIGAVPLASQSVGTKLEFSELAEFDKNGNEIHTKKTYEEIWRKFDSNGRMIYSKTDNDAGCL